MPIRDLRFALDGEGVKALAPTLVDQTISYWEDNRLCHGRVSRAEVKRDRYGNPYVEVELEEAGSPPAALAGSSSTSSG